MRRKGFGGRGGLLAGLAGRGTQAHERRTPKEPAGQRDDDVRPVGFARLLVEAARVDVSVSAAASSSRRSKLCVERRARIGSGARFAPSQAPAPVKQVPHACSLSQLTHYFILRASIGSLGSNFIEFSCFVAEVH